MDAVRLGAVCRALRIKKRWRQIDLARRAGVSRSVVSDIETGRISRSRVEDVLSVIGALGGRIDFMVRCQGGDLDRLLNARHALHVRGERGVIDILAWHAATRTLLIIELKTEIVDVSELMGTLDKKVRLAPDVARARGWYAARVAVWLIVGASKGRASATSRCEPGQRQSGRH